MQFLSLLDLWGEDGVGGFSSKEERFPTVDRYFLHVTTAYLDSSTDRYALSACIISLTLCSSISGYGCDIICGGE